MTPVLETARLVLSPFAPEDWADCLRNYRADPRMYVWTGGHTETEDEIRQWLAGAAEAYADPDTAYWAVRLRGGEVIGEVFVDDFGRRNRWCELDWRIGPAFQKKGYATEAASAAMEFLLSEAGFHRVQAKYAAENAASLRVMEKLGMRREGVLREFFRDREGRYHDVVLCARVREEK